jgi:hypothetical protein
VCGEGGALFKKGRNPGKTIHIFFNGENISEGVVNV